jgi:hypothetical protein
MPRGSRPLGRSRLNLRSRRLCALLVEPQPQSRLEPGGPMSGGRALGKRRSRCSCEGEPNRSRGLPFVGLGCGVRGDSEIDFPLGDARYSALFRGAHGRLWLGGERPTPSKYRAAILAKQVRGSHGSPKQMAPAEARNTDHQKRVSQRRQQTRRACSRLHHHRRVQENRWGAHRRGFGPRLQ